jgi:hypothetical protein
MPPLAVLLERASLQTAVVVDALQIPAWYDWSAAVVATAHNCTAAVQSVWHLLTVSGRPVVLLLYISSKWLLVGAYESGAQQLQGAVWKAYKFQRRLSPVETAVEVGLVTLAVLLYQLRLYLQRNTIVQRTIASMRRRQRSVVQVRAILLYVLYCVVVYVMAVVPLSCPVSPWSIRSRHHNVVLYLYS